VTPRMLASAGLVIVLAALPGCGKSKAKESLVQEWISVLHQTADVLATITDEASAKAVAPKFKPLWDKEKDLREKVEAQETRKGKHLLGAMAGQFHAAWERREAELKRVSAMPAVRDILNDALAAR
jgi:hypothetical protein